jgi:hypothetical protein
VTYPLTSPWLLLLEQDLAFISNVHQSLVIANAPRNPTEDEARYFGTALALWGTLVDHCRAITLLLPEGLTYPARALNRTAYETCIHLIYLTTVGDKYENARLYETRMLYETIKTMPSGFTSVASEMLAAVPAEIREKVERIRSNRRLQWCGKRLPDMATDIRIRQHDGLFSMLSWATHGLTSRLDMQEVRSAEEGLTYWRPEPDSEDVDVVAMHTRRTALRPAYYLATRSFYGAAPPLPTPKPHNGY